MAKINMTEDDIIKRKLLIDGDGLGDDRRINLAMKSFFRWCSFNDSEEDQDANYQRILYMLTNCEHSMAKSQQILYMNQMEMSNYQQLYQKIENGIQDSQRKINDLKSELQKAKIVRKNKQEYDVLAKIIMENPDRKETLARLNELESEIEKLQRIKEELNQKLNARSKQFQVLISSAHELQKILSQEDSLDDKIDQMLRTNKASGVRNLNENSLAIEKIDDIH